MGIGVILIGGIALFINIAVIYSKFTRGLTMNAWIDLSILAFVLWVFSGSQASLFIGTIASAMFSIFLMISPPKEDMFTDW